MSTTTTAALIAVLSIVALLAGPLLYLRFRQSRAMLGAIDGFVILSVGGLLSLHVLPTAFEDGGVLTALWLLAGLMLPGLLERGSHKAGAEQTHLVALGLAVVALVVHTIVDGIAIGNVQADIEHALPTAIAVVMHRLPVGIAVWVIVRPERGANAAYGVLALIAVGTIIGFVGGQSLLAGLDARAFAWFQAFVAGSVVHVLFHAHGMNGHDHDHDHDHGHGHDHGRMTSGALRPAARQAGAPFVVAAIRAPATEATTIASCCDPSSDAPGAGDGLAKRWGLHDVRARVWETVGGLVGVAVVIMVTWFERMGGHAHGAGDAAGHGHGHGHGGGREAVIEHVHEHAHEHAHETGSALIEVAATRLAGAHDHSGVAAWLERLLELTLETAPALLLGYVLAGLVHALLPARSMSWMNRGGDAQRAFRGMAFGTPLPICSCGVLPVYQSLTQRGASTAAATAFLVATPEIGIEALVLSVPLLGWELTGVRLLAAAFVAFVTGVIVARYQRRSAGASEAGAGESGPVARITPGAPPARTSLGDGLRHGLLNVVDDTAAWILVGLAIAAAIEPEALSWFLQGVPGLLQLVAFGLIGIPMYVCAAGATPIAAALIFAGVSPGAALVFLLAGPATNVTTFGVLTRLHGRGHAVVFIASVLSLALLAGIVVDAVLPPGVLLSGLGEHEHGSHTLGWIALVPLALIFLYSLLRRGPRAWVGTVLAGEHQHDHGPADGHAHGSACTGGR